MDNLMIIPQVRAPQSEPICNAPTDGASTAWKLSALGTGARLAHVLSPRIYRRLPSAIDCSGRLTGDSENAPPNRPCRTSVRSADNPTRAESRLRERWMHGAQAFRLDIRCFERITRHSENARLRKGRAGLENWQDSSRETPVTAVETSSHARPLGRTVGLTDNCPAKRVTSRCVRRTAPTPLFDSGPKRRHALCKHSLRKLAGAADRK